MVKVPDQKFVERGNQLKQKIAARWNHLKICRLSPASDLPGEVAISWQEWSGIGITRASVCGSHASQRALPKNTCCCRWPSTGDGWRNVRRKMKSGAGAALPLDLNHNPYQHFFALAA
jgi:hypothetical protein